MPTQTAYIVTKHAVEAFSECLFLEMEVAKAPIHVSSIIPGMVKTRIFDADAGEGEDEGARACADVEEGDQGAHDFLRVPCPSSPSRAMHVASPP